MKINKELNRDLKRLRLIPKTKAYKQQLTLAKYMYIFILGVLFAELFM